MQTTLLYHLTPMSSYERHLNILKAHRPLFTNMIVAIAVDDSADSKLRTLNIPLLKKEIPNTVFIEVPNTKIRETESFPFLLQELRKLHNANDTHYVCYAHSKGVTRGGSRPVTMWTDSLYYVNLFHQKPHHEALGTDDIDTGSTFDFSGAYRLISKTHMLPVILQKVGWHYSGTFWWTTAKLLLAKNTPPPEKDRYAMEGYPATVQPNHRRSNVVFGTKICNFYQSRCISYSISRIDSKRPPNQKVYPYYQHIIKAISSQAFPTKTEHTNLLYLLYAAVYKLNTKERQKTLREVLPIIEKTLGLPSKEDAYADTFFRKTSNAPHTRNTLNKTLRKESKKKNSPFRKKLLLTKRVYSKP